MVALASEKPGVVSLLVITFAAACEAFAALTPAELSDSDATSRIFETDVLAALIFKAAWISAALAPGAAALAVRLQAQPSRLCGQTVRPPAASALPPLLGATSPSQTSPCA